MEKSSIEPNRRRKIIPNVGKARKNPTESDPSDKIPSQSTDTLRKTNAPKKNSQVYVLSPDLVKKFGIDIPKLQNESSCDANAEKFEQENISKRKTDSSSIKKSLQNKLLAKVVKNSAKHNVKSNSNASSSPKANLQLTNNSNILETPPKLKRPTKSHELLQPYFDEFQYPTGELSTNVHSEPTEINLNMLQSNVTFSSNTETAKIISSTLLLSPGNSSTNFENRYSQICNLNSSTNSTENDINQKQKNESENNSPHSSPSKNNTYDSTLKKSENVQNDGSIMDSDNSVISDILSGGINSDSEHALEIIEIPIEEIGDPQILTHSNNADSEEFVNLSEVADNSFSQGISKTPTLNTGTNEYDFHNLKESHDSKIDDNVEHVSEHLNKKTKVPNSTTKVWEVNEATVNRQPRAADHNLLYEKTGSPTKNLASDKNNSTVNTGEEKLNTIQEYLKQFLQKSRSKPIEIENENQPITNIPNETKTYALNVHNQIDLQTTDKFGIEKLGGKRKKIKILQNDSIELGSITNQETMKSLRTYKAKNVENSSSSVNTTQPIKNVNFCNSNTEVQTDSVEVSNVNKIIDDPTPKVVDNDISNETQLICNAPKSINDHGTDDESNLCSIAALRENSQNVYTSIHKTESEKNKKDQIDNSNSLSINNVHSYFPTVENVEENIASNDEISNKNKNEISENLDTLIEEIQLTDEIEFPNNVNSDLNQCIEINNDPNNENYSQNTVLINNNTTTSPNELLFFGEHNYSCDNLNSSTVHENTNIEASIESNLVQENILEISIEVDERDKNNENIMPCDVGLLKELDQINIRPMLPKKRRSKKRVSAQKSIEILESNSIPNEINECAKASENSEIQISNENSQREIIETNELSTSAETDKLDFEENKNRKRKRKLKPIDESDCSDQEKKCPDEMHNLKPKKGKMAGSQKIFDKNESVQSDTCLDNDVVDNVWRVKKPGRPKKSETKSKQRTVQNKNKSSNICCGVCQKVVLGSRWRYHVSDFHNGLAWAEGETPIDMNDEKLLWSILQARLKSGKQLKCEKCSMSRRSTLGFIAHLKVCEKTEHEILEMREECPVCKRKMLPQSLKLHMLVHSNPKPIELKTDDNDSSAIYDKKVKRKAAQMAEETFKTLKISNDEIDSSERNNIAKKLYKKITKPTITKKIKSEWSAQILAGSSLKCPHVGCDHIEQNESEMTEHYLVTCDKRPQNIHICVCSLCEFSTKTNGEMIKHIVQCHFDDVLQHANNNFKKELEPENNSSEDDNNDGTDEENMDSKKIVNNRTARPQSRNQAEFIYTRDAIKENNKFHINYGEKFISKNFVSSLLFVDIPINEYNPVSLCESASFLPENKTSCKIGYTLYTGKKFDHSNVSVEWKQYEIFESDIHNGSLTMWCGGPVWSIAWVPGNHDVQYLAVAANREMENQYVVRQSYSHKNIIQIWNVGHLSNETNCCESLASMVYGIAHNHGVIWDMEFCPSGCNDDSNCDFKIPMNAKPVRMGLLAVACSDGNCYIYNIYHPLTLPACESKLFNTIPSIELQLEEPTSCNLGNSSVQATRISWSKLKNHSIIAVGYSNGMIALFDLSTKSSLLLFTSESKIILLPYYTFQPYITPINGVKIMPFDRLLNNHKNNISIAVSSLSGCGIWNGNIPVVNKLGRFTNTAVTYPWPQIVGITEEINPSTNSKALANGAPVICPKFSSYSEIRILQSSTLYGGGVCDTNFWHNGLVIGNYTGDIYLNPILSPLVSTHRSIKKKVRRRALLSFAELVNVKGDPIVRSNLKLLKEIDRALELAKSSNHFIPDTITYEETCEKYGLLFVDVPYTSGKELHVDSYKSKECQPDLWYLQSVLSLRSNPSQDAHLFQAFGGRAGHVRIMCASHLHKKRNSIKNNKEAYF